MGDDPKALEAFRKCGCGPFTGVIKKVGNKFGFIESDSVSRHFKKDVFVTKDVLPQGVDAGARVTFKLKLSEKGDPQAETLYVSPAKNQQKSNHHSSLRGTMYPNSNVPQQQALMNMQQQQYYLQQMQMQQMHEMQMYGQTRPSSMGFGNYQPMAQQRGVALNTRGGIQNNAGSHSMLKPYSQDIYKGIVKTLFREKQYAFVTCNKTHADFHRDVFFEKDETANMSVGDEVEFLLFLNDKGQPVGKLVPPHGIFTGVLKVYNNLRGYGFVECADSTRIYGSDVFIHKKEVELYPTAVGDQIEFSIFLNMHNQPQAIRTQIFRGTIMSRGKFLFLSCKETKRKFGQDVFLMKNVAKGFNVDDEVNFTVIVNHKGQPQAYSVSSGAEHKEVTQTEADNTVYEGKVKSLGPKYGFVDSPKAHVRYGSDVFLLVTTNLAGSISIGDTVHFTVQMNEKNQPQAVHPRLDRKRSSTEDSEKA